MISPMEMIKNLISTGAGTAMTERQFFQQEIARWKQSTVRQSQITGEQYYHGQHDILDRTRTVIGKDGKIQEIHNLPNNKIVDNQYSKMVDQKTNYLLGKPFTIQTDNERYEQALKLIFNKRFHRLFQNLGEDSLNSGIGWLYVYYNEKGEFCFTRFAPYEVLPFWKDADHTILDCVVRLYEVEAYEGHDLDVIEKVEIYKTTGIERYTLSEGVLVDDVENPSSTYMTRQGKGYNWERVPVIPFKYNDEEIPLICKVKSLQDAINTTLSDFQNNMQEDSRNTILIIKNYDGENLADFRYNLAQYGAIKVKTIDGAAGDVDALNVEVNSDNYKVLLELLKKALIENAMGYDAKNDRLLGNPNQMNIMSMYSDIDLDANGMETEYQASFEDLLFFVNAHLANTGGGNFKDADVEIIFNRDMLINEADIISNVKNSVGLLSTESLLAQHPWCDDVAAEIKRLDAEKQKAIDEYANAFPAQNKDGDPDDDESGGES
jgi:SPP1 family phage portal protein